MKKICKICGQEFETIKNGHTRKYCYNCVPSQTEGFTHAEIVTYKRNSMKKALVKYKGGACCKCGYNKCLRALEFHHLNENEKDFGISKTCKDFDDLKKEVDKCILVCSNCHAEIHEELDNKNRNITNI